MPRTGYQSKGDVAISRLADGTLIRDLWFEFNDVLGHYNDHRTTIVSLLSHRTAEAASAVAQDVSTYSLYRASEYSVPPAVGSNKPALIGSTLNDYHGRSAFTWKFLRDASADQVRQSFGLLLEADNKLVTHSVLKRILDPAIKTNEIGVKCFGLWSNDGIMSPPPHLGRTFPSTTTHYLPTGATQIDSLDIEDAFVRIQQKGMGVDPNTQLLILANPDNGKHIQGFRAGEQSRPAESGEDDEDVPVAKYSFIPSAGSPAYILDGNIQGKLAPADYSGLKVAGSYGPAYLIETDFVPSGYVIVCATGGPDSDRNCVSLREHTSNQWRGLLLIPGPQSRYPLEDAIVHRAIGTGVRHRSAAVALKVGTGSYSAPNIVEAL